MNKLVCGVGINDADYPVSPRVNSKKIKCPFYRRWENMLKRCYSAVDQAKRPTYIGCTVCDEWLTFSNFKMWMEGQEWQGKQLDKDLLVEGNRVYSPDTCVFIDIMTNSFTIDCGAARGSWPIGVILHKYNGRFSARCSNPFSKEQEHLGYFACPQEAHKAWLARKHELACQLADLQSDVRVAQALRLRYAAK